MYVLNLTAGAMLLFAGRRLFWLSVACMGFLAAYRYSLASGFPGPGWMTWVIPAVVGLIGAVVAILFQKVAVILIGFMIGEMLTLDCVHLLNLDSGRFSWIILVAGGLAGAIILMILFDWALIVLSSLIGASVLIPVSGLGTTGGNLPFLFLAILGMAVQTLFFLKTRNPRTARKKNMHC